MRYVGVWASPDPGSYWMNVILIFVICDVHDKHIIWLVSTLHDDFNKHEVLSAVFGPLGFTATHSKGCPAIIRESPLKMRTFPVVRMRKVDDGDDADDPEDPREIAGLVEGSLTDLREKFRPSFE
eukprot:scaffold21752_cov30-Prasinocladus_malaysianus.AAC.3